MKTYQDLLDNLSSDRAKADFILAAISDHKASEQYKMALIAWEYAARRNVTISNYRKMLYTMAGEAVPDNYTANHKMASNFFYRFVTQETQYLLGNGVKFQNEKTREKFGRHFDNDMQKLGKYALIGGVAFGFFNLDHIDVFKITEFVPLWDEEDGALKAGIRFWQIDEKKPLRCTLYELDGYTDFIKRDKADMEILHNKRSYTQIVRNTPADGDEILDGENYPAFPIVPLWGNENHQSELVGIREQIDAYDLIKSGFANDLDDVSQIYWVLTNAGGMDDVDLAKFIQHMKTVKAATVDGDEGATAEAHTIDVPYQARETYLTRLETDLYHDAMALNTSAIFGSNVNEAQIRAAYEDFNNKTDEFEYCIIEFMDHIFELAGIEDEISFNRSQLLNQLEVTQMVLAAASYMDEYTVLKKLPFLTADEVEEIRKNRQREDMGRLTDRTSTGTPTAPKNTVEEIGLLTMPEFEESEGGAE